MYGGYFLKKIYLKGTVTERGGEPKKEISFICSHSQLELSQPKARDLEPHPGLLHGGQGLNLLDHLLLLSWILQQAAGPEVEQAGLEPVLTWDAGICEY